MVLSEMAPASASAPAPVRVPVPPPSSAGTGTGTFASPSSSSARHRVTPFPSTATAADRSRRNGSSPVTTASGLTSTSTMSTPSYHPTIVESISADEHGEDANNNDHRRSSGSHHRRRRSSGGGSSRGFLGSARNSHHEVDYYDNHNGGYPIQGGEELEGGLGGDPTNPTFAQESTSHFDADYSEPPSSARDSSSTNVQTSNPTSQRNDGLGVEEIAPKENKAVTYLRMIFISVLFTSTVTVGLIIFLQLRRLEIENFEEQYQSDVETIATNIIQRKFINQILSSTESFATTYMLLAQIRQQQQQQQQQNDETSNGSNGGNSSSTNMTLSSFTPSSSPSSEKPTPSSSSSSSSLNYFPFVAIPGFALQATKLLRHAGAFHVQIAPIVASEERIDWEKYANDSSALWIDESLDFQQKQEEQNQEEEEENAPGQGQRKNIYNIFDDTHFHDNDTMKTTYDTPYEISTLIGEPVESTQDISNSTYLPIWQQAPLTFWRPSSSKLLYGYNVDYWTIRASGPALRHAIKTRTVSWHDDHFIDSDASTVTLPAVVLHYPLLNTTMDTIQVDHTNDDHTVVGILSLSISWTEILNDVVPRNTLGIVVVIESSCNDGNVVDAATTSFSFQLDGRKSPKFLGYGDFHDEDFSHMEYVAPIIIDRTDDGVNTNVDMGDDDDRDDDRNDKGDYYYTGLPLANEFCPKLIKIYPSHDTKALHQSQDPKVFSLVTAAVFALAAIIFCCYDRFVSRRQRKVLKRALASGAIVSSLFPEKVKHQLYDVEDRKLEEQEQQELDRRNSVFREYLTTGMTEISNRFSLQQELLDGSSRRLGAGANTSTNPLFRTLQLANITNNNNSNSLSAHNNSAGGGLSSSHSGADDATGGGGGGGASRSAESGAGGNGTTAGTGPIADQFEHTTVFFGDIAGFTPWSATRTPSQVFELLETLYEAIDKIALRRAVFKVETIGDCYVAVTGLPEPQDNHAVIMARFARDCIHCIRRLTVDLVDHLGPDTADLELRIGLHSGSTTAGVLRGTKGRFQLFGDTVNTASRMESHGVKGRIHASQATADALILRGKSSWLVPREDLVNVKGKGTMQTYFIVNKSDTSIAASYTMDETTNNEGDPDSGAFQLSGGPLGGGSITGTGGGGGGGGRRRSNGDDTTTTVGSGSKMKRNVP